MNLVYILIALLMPLSAMAQTVPDDLEFVRNALKDPSVHEVVIPAGSYTANRPIVVNRSDVSLVGQGQVVITLANHANSPLLILGNIQTPPEPIYNVKVDNIVLRGNRENQDEECWGGPCDSGGETFIRNNGITIRGVHGAEITNVETTGMRSGGVVTEKVCTNLHIDGLVTKDNYFDGFAGYQTTGSTFRNVNSSYNLGAGISIDIGFHENTLEDWIIDHNTDVGIFMRDSNGNKFRATTIKDSGNHAVFVSQVDNQIGTVPINNIFEDLTINGARGNGFHLNHPGKGNKLINPRFSNVRGQEVFDPQHVLQISCGKLF